MTARPAPGIEAADHAAGYEKLRAAALGAPVSDRAGMALVRWRGFPVWMKTCPSAAAPGVGVAPPDAPPRPDELTEILLAVFAAHVNREERRCRQLLTAG